MKYALAIDIGASSGRHIVGWKEEGQIKTKEVYRFPNGVKEQDGHLTWDMTALLEHVKKGIAIAQESFEIESFSIDTWAVDYVLLNGSREICPCYAYRDSRTQPELVHEILPFSELYRKTGIQFQPFNTIYQLYADKLCGRLDKACGFLMIPEYLLYKLTGVKSHEYTNATTTGLVSAQTGEYDVDLIERLGLPKRFFKPLQQPGTVIGTYRGIKAVLCATHDTASAVEGIPMEGNEPYISSGTWSLLGVKTERPLTNEGSQRANYSNEGGVGYHRYQKNIMGNWLTNRLKDELAPDQDFKSLDAEVWESGFDGLIDPNDPAFVAPASMKEAFDEALDPKPQTVADYFRCAYRSLAKSYQQALEELERNTGKRYERLYIVGGGAKNKFLNEAAAQFTGKRVIALPIEATAIGNLKIQLQREETTC